MNGKPLLELFPQISRAKTANIHTYTASTNGYVPNDLYAPFADKLESTLAELRALGQSYEEVVIGGKAFKDEIIETFVEGGTWSNENGLRFLSASTSESVAEHFINMSKTKILNGTLKAVKLEII